MPARDAERAKRGPLAPHRGHREQHITTYKTGSTAYEAREAAYFRFGQKTGIYTSFALDALKTALSALSEALTGERTTRETGKAERARTPRALHEGLNPIMLTPRPRRAGRLRPGTFPRFDACLPRWHRRAGYSALRLLLSCLRS